MEECIMFQYGGGGGGSDGGLHFKVGGHPMGGYWFWLGRGFSKKNYNMGDAPHAPPHYGKP